MEIFFGDNFNRERNQENDKTKRGKNFPEKSSSVLNWIGMNFERSRTPRTHHRHFWLVEIYICIWTGAYSFDKSRFFNGHSLDSKRNSLLTHLSKLHNSYIYERPASKSRRKVFEDRIPGCWKPEIPRERAGTKAYEILQQQSQRTHRISSHGIAYRKWLRYHRLQIV